MSSRASARLRDQMINLRANKTQRTLIDSAAEALGKKRSEFMLEAACREATSVLADQRYFIVDERTFREFTAALDKAPAENTRLRQLLGTKAPWDK
jgi:uncharacterized protein (DUF1778 family)